jgi:hypothetical protein
MSTHLRSGIPERVKELLVFKPNLIRFEFGAILLGLPLVLSPSAKADSQLDPPLALPQTAQNTHCVVSLDPRGQQRRGPALLFGVLPHILRRDLCSYWSQNSPST